MMFYPDAAALIPEHITYNYIAHTVGTFAIWRPPELNNFGVDFSSSGDFYRSCRASKMEEGSIDFKNISKLT